MEKVALADAIVASATPAVSDEADETAVKGAVRTAHQNAGEWTMMVDLVAVGLLRATLTAEAQDRVTAVLTVALKFGIHEASLAQDRRASHPVVWLVHRPSWAVPLCLHHL